MMASDLSSGCTETIDILDDEKEEGEISLEDVSSSEEGGISHLSSGYVAGGRTRLCPDCKSWGECATWCSATYHLKSQNRRDAVKGKENCHHIRETGCAAVKHTATTLQEKNDDLVPISSDSDMEIVGLTDTSNKSRARVKKKKRKKKYESLTIDDLLSPSTVDLTIPNVNVLKLYREVSPVHRPSDRSKMIPRSPIRRYRSPVAARASFRSSRSPLNHSRSPVQKRSLRKVRSPKRSPRRHSPVRAAKRPLSSARFHVDRHGDVTRLLKKVKQLDSMGTYASEPSVNRNKESSSLKEKLLHSNMLNRVDGDDHAMQLKEKSEVQPETINDPDDEEDLALLRQKALETKQKKTNRFSDHPAESEKKSAANDEDDDDDDDDQDEEALQLRMIALRSAVMKKHQNRVQRGIKAKRSTRSESPFSTSFLDDIPVPGDLLLKYASPPCTPSYDSNHIEDMDLDTDVEREKEKLPYSPTDKITETVPIDTTLLGIEPSDVSFINVNETIASPVFDDTQDELATDIVTPYYNETYLPYQVPLPNIQYYSPSQYSASDFNDAVGKAPENPHDNGVVCDLIDGICCQKGTYASTGCTMPRCIVPHALPVSKNLLATSVSPPSGTLASSPQTQQMVEQPSNENIVFVNVDKSAYETQTIPGYSDTDAPITTVYAAGYAESMSPNESMITIDDLPENYADPFSPPNVPGERNLPDTEYIPKEAASCQVTVEEPLYMQGVPDITKDTNKIPTLINRTLVPVPILKSNKRLRQHLKKRATPQPEPTFKSAEMQPVTIVATDMSNSVFKPIKLQVAKKSSPVLSTPATFDNLVNESLDMPEDQRDLSNKSHEIVELEHSNNVNTLSTSSKITPVRRKKTKTRRLRTKKVYRKSLENAPLSEIEKSPCSDAVNKDTNIMDTSTINGQTAIESDQSKDNEENLIKNGELLRLQSVIDTRKPVNSDDVTINKIDVEKNNNTASVGYSQEEHIESHCLSTNPAPDNLDPLVSNKTVNTMESDSNRRQSLDEDEDQLRAILLASLKRTKSDANPSVASGINSIAINVQTPALKTPGLASTTPSTVNGTCTASNNVPSRPLTSLENVKKKINDVSISVQNGSRKRSSSVDTVKNPAKKIVRKMLTSTKVVNNAKKYQNMIVQRRLNLRKLDNSASITKSNETVWPNVSASKISHVSDTQRFVISLGSDTDSESEGERREPVFIEKQQVHQEIPPDFEKNLNKFLRDVRTEQEQSAAAKSFGSPATKQDVPQTDKGSSNMHTPLAVRHLPASQQEEYRRLKQEILEREKLKLQRKVASNNNNSSSSSSSKVSNANVASSPVKFLPMCEKKAHIKQNQDKLKTPERSIQEVKRKNDDLARGTSESNACCTTADKKLSVNITEDTNFTHLQAKNNKKVIPNNLSIRISNVTAPGFTGGARTIENSREICERQARSAKDKQQHRSALKALSVEEINHKHVAVLLKPDTLERVVIINDKSELQHDTVASVDQNENLAEPNISTEIINERSLNNGNDNNVTTFSDVSTVKFLDSSANSSSRQHEDTMETTMTLSQYQAEHQREISRDTLTSVLTENNDSNNSSQKSDVIVDDTSLTNGNTNDVYNALKKDAKAELDSLTSLPKVEQERYLRETEYKLVEKRYMILDHLAEMSGNLRRWDMEEDVQIALANEVKKLKEKLKVAEAKLQQQRDLVNTMGPKVSSARQKINIGRHECFKLSRICSTLGNRLMGKNYKLPEAVDQLLSDKMEEIAIHTRQFTKKKRLQSNDISENSYSSLSQETSELSKNTCTEENLSLQEQPTNNTTEEAGSKIDTFHSTQSSEDKSLSTISETLLDFSQIPCQSTSEERKKISVNASEHSNEKQIIFPNQDSESSSEPKLYQSSSTEQKNEHIKENRTDKSDPAASSELKLSVTDFSKQKQINNTVLPRLPSPSPSSMPTSPTSSLMPSSSPTSMPTLMPTSSPSLMTTTTTTTTTTSTTTTIDTTSTNTTTTIASYTSVLTHLKKPRNINPNGILCPYEMMGICRDEDCQFIHLSRNQT